MTRLLSFLSCGFFFSLSIKCNTQRIHIDPFSWLFFSGLKFKSVFIYLFFFIIIIASSWLLSFLSEQLTHRARAYNLIIFNGYILAHHIARIKKKAMRIFSCVLLQQRVYNVRRHDQAFCGLFQRLKSNFEWHSRASAALKMRQRLQKSLARYVHVEHVYIMKTKQPI